LHAKVRDLLERVGDLFGSEKITSPFCLAQSARSGEQVAHRRRALRRQS
jgi:hypothetical protein